MPHRNRRGAFLIPRLFEREQHMHRRPLQRLPRPAQLAGGLLVDPSLGRSHEQHGNTQATGQPRQAQIEPRVIHQHRQVRAEPSHFRRGPGIHPQGELQIAQHVPRPAEGRKFHGEQRRKPPSLRRASTQSPQLHVWIMPAKARQDGREDLIPGNLSGRDEDLGSAHGDDG